MSVGEQRQDLIPLSKQNCTPWPMGQRRFFNWANNRRHVADR
ncbi:hypothetical protein [Nocardia gipuzkoensis]